jgi:hypothetical protein
MPADAVEQVPQTAGELPGGGACRELPGGAAGVTVPLARRARQASSAAKPMV